MEFENKIIKLINLLKFYFYVWILYKHNIII